MSKPTLVVVGGGIAGIKAVQHAVKSGLFDVILVEPRDYLEVPFPAVRAIVQPTLGDKTVIPLSGIPHMAPSILNTKATQVSSKAVVLEDGTQLRFDYAIIATGSTHSGAGVVTPNVNTASERKAQLTAVAERVKKAKSIVVVGGGPVGIEVVGEIVEQYAGKQVTLLHGGPQLLEGKDAKLHAYLAAAMAKHKVQLVLNDHAAKWDEAACVLHTRGGQQIPADYVVWAAGSTPNTLLFKSGDLACTLTDRSLVKVDPHLRVEGHSHMYAIGDINNTPPPKLGYLADLQAAMAVANLVKTVKGQSKGLAAWNPPMQPKGVMMVTYGKGNGVLQVGGCVCTGGVLGKLKSKDMFVGKVRKDLGLED